MNEIIKNPIDRFYSQISDYDENKPNTRYKSWEWCHQAFLDKKENATNEDIDYLALHLAFYLASWGMYRGSSFLLQRDYKAHKKAVRMILENQYKSLWNFDPKDDNDIDKANKKLFGGDGEEGIYWKLKAAYNGTDSKTGNDLKDTPSDTLVTKILMGTYACIPAFDRFFKAGITKIYEGQKFGEYSLTQSVEKSVKNIKPIDSFKTLATLAMNHGDIFKVEEKTAIEYPIMKCVDMYFWEIGYELDIANLLSDDTNEDKKKKLYEKAKTLRCFNDSDINGQNDDEKYKAASDKIIQLIDELILKGKR